VNVHRDAYRLMEGSERFEDGTPAFTAVGAVPMALAASISVGRERLADQCADLTHRMLDALAGLQHTNGHSLARVFAPQRVSRGPTIAFTPQDATGVAIPYWQVEQDARAGGIALRGGCFCNPGCAEAAFGLDTIDADRCLEQLGRDFSIPSFADCMGGRAVGALRISFGLGSIAADVDVISRFLSRYLDNQ
jgi:selenocysteine lyase/cysteine desulfurase